MPLRARERVLCALCVSAVKAFPSGQRCDCLNDVICGDAKHIEKLFFFSRVRHAGDCQVLEFRWRCSCLCQSG